MHDTHTFVSIFSVQKFTNLSFLIECSDMLSYGCTRLEIGVQSVYEDVARDTNRFRSSLIFRRLCFFMPFQFFTCVCIYLQRAHRAGGLRLFFNCKRCRLQGSRAHDARFAECRNRARSRAISGRIFPSDNFSSQFSCHNYICTINFQCKFALSGILGKSGFPCGWPENLPHPSDPRHGPIRIVANGALPQLPGERADRANCPCIGGHPALVSSVPCTKRHPNAPSQQWRRARQSQRARARPHEGIGLTMSRCTHSRGRITANSPKSQTFQGIFPIQLFGPVCAIH